MPSTFQMEIAWSKYVAGHRPGDETWSHFDQEALEHAIKHNLWGLSPRAPQPLNATPQRSDMQDPTAIIKELVDQLEHAHDVLTDLDFTGCEERRPKSDEEIDRLDALMRAKSWLTAQGNADLFADTPEPTA